MDSLTDEIQNLARSSTFRELALVFFRGARCRPGVIKRHSSHSAFPIFRFLAPEAKMSSIKRQAKPTGREGKPNRFMQKNYENKSINGEFFARHRDD